MTSGVEILLLGEVGARGSTGGTRALAHMEKALLARLALDAGRVITIDRLIDDLWQEAPPKRARNALQVYVSHLRSYLGAPRIRSSGGGYCLALPEQAVDCIRFMQLAASGAALAGKGCLTEARTAFEQALELWRGDPLAELADHAFARTEATRLCEVRAAALEGLANVELQSGRHDRVVTDFGPLVEEFPFRDGIRAAVMTALYRQGRTADALKMFQDCRVILREELGLDPGPGLKALQAAILDDDPSLVTAAPAAWRDVGAVPPPATATSLVGRAVDLGAVGTMIGAQEVRLVSLLGAGGTGKTRLALELATSPPVRFTGATVWVSLAAISNPAQVLSTIAAALRLQAAKFEVTQVAACLNGGPSLLILDNAEHLLPDVASVVAELIGACEQLSVLVTSRTALHLSEEHRYLLGALEVPNPQDDLDTLRLNPAVTLFTNRAAQVQPGFVMDARNASAVAGICARLDALPLALELAAARANLLEPSAMLARLELQSRLGLLTTGTVHPDHRHRSLRDTLDWSYRLLTSGAANLLASLSVFRGGFTLAAAERHNLLAHEFTDPDHAANDGHGDHDESIMEAFQELLDASLLSPNLRDYGRFFMLETVLEYSEGKLELSGHDDVARDAHCELFREALNGLWTTAPTAARTATEVAWFMSEQDNLRVATEWASQRGYNIALAHLATGAFEHWDSTGQGLIAKKWLTQVADSPDVGIRRCDAERSLSILLASHAPLEEAMEHIERAVRLLDEHGQDWGRLALAFSTRSALSHFAGEDEDARRDARTAIGGAEATDDLDIRATALVGCGVGLFSNRAAARKVLRSAKQAAFVGGNERILYGALNNLAELALADGDGAMAVDLCSEAVRLELVSRLPSELAGILNIMAGGLLLAGDLARARSTLREGLRLGIRSGQLHFVTEAVLYWAALASAIGDVRGAAVLFGCHEETMRILGRHRVDGHLTVYERFLARLDEKLHADEMRDLLAYGARLTTQDLLDWLIKDGPSPLLTSSLGQELAT